MLSLNSSFLELDVLIIFHPGLLEQGPDIQFSYGRVDNTSCAQPNATVLIPDAMGDAFNQNSSTGSFTVTADRAAPAIGDFNITGLRAKFARMGLDDLDTVALSGAHTVGFGHPNASGFLGAWTTRPMLCVLAAYYFLVAC